MPCELTCGSKIWGCEVASRQQRLGVLVVALEPKGRRILDDLVARPDIQGAPLDGHYVETGDADEFAWHHRTADSKWHAPDWAKDASGFEQGMTAAVRHMLDVTRWQDDHGTVVDLLDILVLATGTAAINEAVSASLIEALESVKRRFRRVARVLLVCEDEVQTIGEAAVPGRVVSLPFHDGSDRGVFELIVLLDRVNTQGMVLEDESKAIARTAAVMAHLTVGELSLMLFQSLQAEQARLGEKGRYVSLGLAEWRLNGDDGVTAMADLLYHRMCKRLTKERTIHAAEDLTNDPWTEPAAQQVQEFQEDDAASLLLPLEEEGHKSLWEQFRTWGWSLGVLERLLARRSDELKRLVALTQLRHLEFLNEFTPWYRAKRIGDQIAEGEPKTVTYTEPHQLRQFLFGLSLLLLIVGLSLVGYYEYHEREDVDLCPYWVLAGVGALGAIVVAALGLEEKKVRVIPPPTPPDKEPELRRMRNRQWLASELATHAEQYRSAVATLRARLEDRADVAKGPWQVVFPYSAELSAGLLKARSLEARESLLRFWRASEESFGGDLMAWAQDLETSLYAFAQERCAGEDDVRWTDVFAATGGVEALDEPVWTEPLERTQQDSRPWIPVNGAHSATLLGLPRSLPAALSSALQQRFGGQKLVKHLPGEDLVILQVAQGYEQPEEPPKVNVEPETEQKEPEGEDT